MYIYICIYICMYRWGRKAAAAAVPAANVSYIYI